MQQLDSPNPPNPAHYKQGLCVNQGALIALLPTVILSNLQSSQIYHRLSDPKHSLKNLFDILLAGINALHEDDGHFSFKQRRGSRAGSRRDLSSLSSPSPACGGAGVQPSLQMCHCPG